MKRYGRVFLCFLYLGLMLGSVQARANVSYGTVDNSVTSPDHYTSFDNGGLADDQVISNQFNTAGFGFTGGLRFRSCGSTWPNTAGGFSPSGYGTNLGPGCTRNTSDDSFRIHLLSDADAFSFTSHTHVLNGGVLQLEVLKDGNSLETFDIDENNDSWCCSPLFVRIDGYNFDEIRVTELLPTSESWITIDNLAYTEASAISAPPVAGLVVVGVFSLIANRQRIIKQL